MTQETDGTGEKDGKQCKVKMETATGGWKLYSKGEIETMCSYIKFVSTSYRGIEEDDRRERGVAE